jgi:hypothetical protein
MMSKSSYLSKRKNLFNSEVVKTVYHRKIRRDVQASNDHRSRCSDLKVQFFQNTKAMLDREEEEGLITSWERVYKHILNN